MFSKEEIEKAKEMLNNLKDYKVLVGGCFVKILTEEENDAIETLLQYINQLEQENNKLNNINDEMAEELAIVSDCPNEDKGANLDCENRCTNDDSIYAECWKQYFEKKGKEK